jgi:hypothetical protein
MATKWRTRQGPRHRGPNGMTEYWIYDNVPGSRHGRYTGTHNNEVQYIVSEGHPYRSIGKRGAPSDIGGPFESQKVEVVLGEGCGPWETFIPAGSEVRWKVFHVPNTTVGTIIDEISNIPAMFDTEAEVKSKLQSQYLAPALESISTLDSWGTSVISAVKPTSPVADLAVSIGEFVSERKFFSLPGTSGSVPGEYLNYMFGVAPTIGLVQDLRNAISNSEELLNQYSRDSGRLVRRQYEPPPEKTTVKTVTPGVPVGSVGTGLHPLAGGSGTLTTITKTTKTWKFSGAFTYYLPKSGWFRTMAELDYLYGIKPGLSVVWELMPYSWLVDYKLNVGDILSNVDAFTQDGLVMPYAYVQRSQNVEVEYTWIGSVYGPNGTLVPKTVTATVYKTTLQRQPATPFGFGISPGSLSLRQVSIIAALGLSRV